MDKVLFETEMDYTYEKYKKFFLYQYLVVFEAQNKAILGAALWFVLTVYSLYEAIVLKDRIFVGFAIMTVVFIPLYIVVNIIFLNHMPLKNWKTFKYLHCEPKVSVRFFEDHFEETSPTGLFVLNYKQLFKVCETDDFFYLLVGKNQSVFVEKVNCDEALMRFIREEIIRKVSE